MPNLVKTEELCFLLLENDILKNKLRFQSTPLQHKFINLLDDLYEDKSNLTTQRTEPSQLVVKPSQLVTTIWGFVSPIGVFVFSSNWVYFGVFYTNW